MEKGRDETGDWLLPAAAAPATVAELEARIEEAIEIARSSEAAAVALGASAMESAEQARHAAELARRASEAASRASAPLPAAAPSGRRDPHIDERLARFSRRADRVGARLARLQRS